MTKFFTIPPPFCVSKIHFLQFGMHLQKKWHKTLTNIHTKLFNDLLVCKIITTSTAKSFIYIPNCHYSFWYAKFKQISLYKISPCIPNYIIEKMVCIFNKKLTFEKKQIHTKLIIQNLVCKLSRKLSQNHKKIHTKLHNSPLVCIYPKKDIKLPQIYIPKSTFHILICIFTVSMLKYFHKTF